MIQLGNYVRAAEANGVGELGGVFIADLGYGYILVQGEIGRYVCKLEGAVTIPDSNLMADTLAFVQYIRLQLRT